VASKHDPFGWVGSTIEGKYRVEALIGEGGFGVVYRAQHLGLGEPVAVKCLKIPATMPPEDRERFHKSFLDEGRVLRKLSRATPAVVQALDVGATASPSGAWTPYLVLEWLRGETLEDDLVRRAKEGRARMALADAIRMLEPAARALAVAHETGIAHRDVKPANLFLADVGGAISLKVLDFGIAKVIADNATVTRAMEATGAAPSMFTPHYGAPEQFNRRFGATGPWTDVFALSLVLVELVSGKAALEGDDVTQLYIAATDPAERPTPRARGVPTTKAVEEVFQRALAIEPKARYRSAGAFWDALREALEKPGEEEMGAHLPPTSPTPLATEVPKTGARPGVARRILPAVLAVFTIASVAFAVVTAARKKPPALQVPTVMRFGPELDQVDVPAGPGDMVLVPAGHFIMGSAKEGKTEGPPHTVTISKPFYIDRTEVRAGDYARCVAAGKCTPSGVHGKKVDEAEAQKYAPYCNGADPARQDHPINCVDQAQAAAYCAFVGKRLPTEAEWEYAARGTDERLYPWGNAAPTCETGNFARTREDGCAGRGRGTLAVGSFPSQPSAFGVLDMAGNVWEWVADGWDPTAYKHGDQKDPAVPAGGENGVLRGGSWDFAPSVAKVTYRLAFDRTMGHVSTGLRCARTAD
jgi:formylglycine-generating enzyme required for sulfatase activity/serine/threonine protein kinase